MGEGGPGGADRCEFPEPVVPAVAVACLFVPLVVSVSSDVSKLSGCKLIQDLENGLYQELITFILVLEQQTKAVFDFSSSVGEDMQCMVGRALSSPTLQ